MTKTTRNEVRKEISSSPTQHKLQLKGWLLVFFIYMIGVLGYRIYMLVMQANALQPIGGGIFEWISFWIPTTLTILAIIYLAKRTTEGIFWGKIYLIYAVVWQIVIDIYQLSIGENIYRFNAPLGNPIFFIIGQIVWIAPSVAWIIYLFRSKQIKNP